MVAGGVLIDCILNAKFVNKINLPLARPDK